MRSRRRFTFLRAIVAVALAPRLRWHPGRWANSPSVLASGAALSGHEHCVAHDAIPVFSMIFGVRRLGDQLTGRVLVGGAGTLPGAFSITLAKAQRGIRAFDCVAPAQLLAREAIRCMRARPRSSPMGSRPCRSRVGMRSNDAEGRSSTVHRYLAIVRSQNGFDKPRRWVEAWRDRYRC